MPPQLVTCPPAPAPPAPVLHAAAPAPPVQPHTLSSSNTQLESLGLRLPTRAQYSASPGGLRLSVLEASMERRLSTTCNVRWRTRLPDYMPSLTRNAAEVAGVMGELRDS